MTVSTMGQKSNPVLVVMAAGIGSRYSGLKQVEPIGPHDELLLGYSIYDALRAGFNKVIFIISREIEKAFRSRIDQTVDRHCQHVYVYQELDNLPAGFEIPPSRQKPWGTAHAVMCSNDVLAAPFGVINADDCAVSMNMWGFTPRLILELQKRFSSFLTDNSTNLLQPEFYPPEVVNQLLDEKRATVKVLPTQERWFGVTYRQDRSEVQKAVLNLIHEGVYPRFLWR
ncbi:MAG TPA: hypothetical protein VE136_06690 [Anaerolineales bacterium]|jgi:bifunctional N-acetylglucosamine-1-phosphate-uridyltransferase/glucosamine-1-phosphate-acetyltransferase GlmU-like protein|nr:hypothetical protein [Anaerolineales bacterium]